MDRKVTQIVPADSRNSERAVESTTEREAEILTTDYRMNADRGPSKCGMRNGELIPPSSRRYALPQSNAVELRDNTADKAQGSPSPPAAGGEGRGGVGRFRSGCPSRPP